MPLIGSLEVLSNATTGTDLGARTKHGIPIGEGPDMPFNWVVLSTGQLLVGNTGADPTPSNLMAGSGIMITQSPGNPGTITITNTGGGGSSFSWTQVSGPTTLTPNAGYVPTGSVTPITLTMPLAGSSSFGNITEIVGNGSMWVLMANGNTIHFVSETAGVSGSLQSTTNYDTIAMLCVSSDTYVVKSSEGNITVT